MAAAQEKAETGQQNKRPADEQTGLISLKISPSEGTLEGVFSLYGLLTFIYKCNTIPAIEMSDSFMDTSTVNTYDLLISIFYFVRLRTHSLSIVNCPLSTVNSLCYNV